MIPTQEQPYLFAAVVPVNACERCFDTGIWLTPRNEVAVCPRVQMREPHCEPNDAALILRRAANRLFQRKLWVNPLCFMLARVLTNYTSAAPCSRVDLFDLFFADTNLLESNKLRKFHSFIEELRSIWLLPIGSRKIEPSGYWMITDLEDFKAWIARVKSAPITQLSTIHRVAKHNFPIFAEQLELEFWNDLNPQSEIPNPKSKEVSDGL